MPEQVLSQASQQHATVMAVPASGSGSMPAPQRGTDIRRRASSTSARSTATLTRTRPRGAGRPRFRRDACRSSELSGDSGDSPDEPPAPEAGLVFRSGRLWLVVDGHGIFHMYPVVEELDGDAWCEKCGSSNHVFHAPCTYCGAWVG
jgi:hypothetical protein